MADNTLVAKNVSYLRARDPSILSYNGPNLANVRTNLKLELDDLSAEEKQNENIQIHLRIKNGYEFDNLYTICGDTLICNVPQGSNCMRNIREGDSLRKIYSFSTIFHPETTQRDIFNSIVKPKMLDFINGDNCTLLTYGASGSGKTFTVIGTDEEPGIVPRSLEYLFRTLPDLSKYPFAKPLPGGNVSILSHSDCKKEINVRNSLLGASSLLTEKEQHVKTYTTMQQRLSEESIAILESTTPVTCAIWVSFAEIYNEQIYDLLLPYPPRGTQRPRLRLGCSNGDTYIKNLTDVSVSSGLEAYQILQFGLHNLNYASTSLNEHSSRSHSIFTIKLVQMAEGNGGSHVCCFNFCDLAGSERSKKTLNVGERLKESNNINSSLLVLSRCISAVRTGQKQHEQKLVPFRESKLTQLFQKALSGHEDIAMIVNISPKREMFDETQHVLTFSAVAKDVAIDRKPAPKKQSRFSQLVESRTKEATTQDGSHGDALEDVEQLRNTVLFLEEELERQKNEFETNEKIERDYIHEGYGNILKEREEDAQRRVKEAEEYVKVVYEMKLQNTRKQYERMLKEMEQNTVINLDDDEEIENLKDQVDHLKERVNALEQREAQWTMESELTDKEILELNIKNRKLSEDLLETKRTLNDAVNDFTALQKMCIEKDKECIILESKCVQLENELAGIRDFMMYTNSESDDACVLPIIEEMNTSEEL